MKPQPQSRQKLIEMIGSYPATINMMYRYQCGEKPPAEYSHWDWDEVVTLFCFREESLMLAIHTLTCTIGQRIP